MKALLAAAALIATAGISPAALAGDALPTGKDWSGLYFGVNGGIGWNDSQVASDFDYRGQTAQSIVDQIDGDQSALTGGAMLGYNFQYGHVVLGAEAEVDYLGFNDNDSTVRNLDAYSATKDVSLNASWYGLLRGRAGFAALGILLYGTGGLAYGNMEASASVNAIDVATGDSVKWDGSSASTNWGWTAGAGIEYGISNMSLGLEYLYVDLGSAEWDGNQSGPLAGVLGNSDANGAADFQFGVTRATLRLGL